ncbi:MAG: zinc ABC transporter substrate-binding protein [Lachnospiraceae bacterium]|nr:zinc ABC transporter substrate-binding protein [Lachnospiraceae bacterium]
MSFLLLTGCTGQTTRNDAPGGTDAGKDRPVIVTTIFPLYDWTDQILGPETDAELVMLLDNGADLHSFQPTAQDVMKIATCDLFLYVGGESDDWVDDALREAVNPDLVALNLLDAMGDLAKVEEHVEGMEEDHDHGAAEDHDETDHTEEQDHAHEEAERDEHIWLSLNNASFLCGVIADALKQIDPDNASRYEENLLSYREQLTSLDEAYRETVAQAPGKTLLFGDRFPFRYLTDDYGLSYYAAFSGCSAETEASFETVTFLSGKTDELGLGSVMIIDGGDGKIAQTIVQNTASKNQKILTLNSMQGITGQDVRDGADYLSVMEENLRVIREALQ